MRAATATATPSHLPTCHAALPAPPTDADAPTPHAMEPPVGSPAATQVRHIEATSPWRALECCGPNPHGAADVPLPVEPTPATHRADRFAVLALLAWTTALFLPWWVMTNRTSDFSFGYTLWSHAEVGVRSGFVLVTILPALLPLALLFIRIAAKSILHEPARWRRDVVIAAALMLLSLALAALWPHEVPFWGSIEYAGAGQVLSGNPGLGWWIGVLASALAAFAWFQGRRGSQE
jgi:hypothetical protein